MVQQVEFTGLHRLTVDPILPLLVNPEHTDVLTQDLKQRIDFISGFLRLDLPAHYPDR